MSNLTLSQASHVKILRSLRLLNLPCKKIVCCYSKEIRNLHEHIHGRHNIVVFPVAYTLLFDSQLVCKLNLVKPLS